MKNAIIGIVVSMCILVTAVTVASIQMNTGIRDEVALTLDTAICTTQRVFYDGRLEKPDNDEYLAEFNRNLEALIARRENEGIEYFVDVYGVDSEKGLLDLQLRARYRNIVGQWREVKERKTMIIEVIDA